MRTFILSFCLIAAAGCEDEESRGHSHALDPNSEDASLAAESDAGCGADIPSRPTAIEATGAQSGMVVKVLSADFDPPRRYANRWIIGLTDSAGAPISEASFSSVRTFMAVYGHMHDGKFVPMISEQPESPGSYVFENVYFTMTGPWQLQFSVTAKGASESFALDVCVGD